MASFDEKITRSARLRARPRSAGFQPASDGAGGLSDSDPVKNRRSSFCALLFECWNWGEVKRPALSKARVILPVFGSVTCVHSREAAAGGPPVE